MINNPTDFTSTFQVYGQQSGDNDVCKEWLPNFPIQFEYLEGDASKYSSSWKGGSTTFDLMTDCNNADNQGRPQTDFPGFY